MSGNKTAPNDADPRAFIASVEDEQKRQDCEALLEIMTEITGQEPKMWGDSIVGFGSYHYVYASGRGGDWLLTGFAPRKRDLTLYIMSGLDHHDEQLEQLGKHKIGKSCLYVKRLSDIDLDVLRELIRRSVSMLKRRWGSGGTS